MRPTASYAKNAISKDDLARLKKEKVRYDIALTQHALLLFPEKKKSRSSQLTMVQASLAAHDTAAPALLGRNPQRAAPAWRQGV